MSILVLVLTQLLAFFAGGIWFSLDFMGVSVVMRHRFCFWHFWCNVTFFMRMLEFIRNNAKTFEALEGEANVIRCPLIVLSKLEAAWLIYSGGVTTPEAVSSVDREQWVITEVDLDWCGHRALIEVLGIFSSVRR